LGAECGSINKGSRSCTGRSLQNELSRGASWDLNVPLAPVVYKVLLDNSGVTQSQTVVFDDAPFVPPPALLPETTGEQQLLRQPKPQESRQPKALSPLPAAVRNEENDSDDEDTGVSPKLPPHGAEAEDATSPTNMATQEQHEVEALPGPASTTDPVEPQRILPVRTTRNAHPESKCRLRGLHVKCASNSESSSC
jgi:hypothetical protein